MSLSFFLTVCVSVCLCLCLYLELLLGDDQQLVGPLHVWGAGQVVGHLQGLGEGGAVAVQHHDGHHRGAVHQLDLLSWRERERETETETETESDRERQRQRDRERQTESKG